MYCACYVSRKTVAPLIKTHTPHEKQTNMSCPCRLLIKSDAKVTTVPWGGWGPVLRPHVFLGACFDPLGASEIPPPGGKNSPLGAFWNAL